MIDNRGRIWISSLLNYGLTHRGVEPTGLRQSSEEELQYIYPNILPNSCSEDYIILFIFNRRIHIYFQISISSFSPLQHSRLLAVCHWLLLFPLCLLLADSLPVRDFSQLQLQVRNFNFKFDASISTSTSTYFTYTVIVFLPRWLSQRHSPPRTLPW